VTNEDRGWHLHLHALIDCRWIDQVELSTVWAKIVGQDIAIVHVSDCRDGQYLREVSKYAVKGTDLATWPSTTLGQYVKAFTGVRTFGTFGTLRNRKKAFKEWQALNEADAAACPCGCVHFKLFTEKEWEWQTLVGGNAPNSPQLKPKVVSEWAMPDLFHQKI
jgi:hypothetical protein